MKFSHSKHVLQGHWQWCHSIGHIRFPINSIATMSLSCSISEILSPQTMNFPIFRYYVAQSPKAWGVMNFRAHSAYVYNNNAKCLFAYRALDYH